jgi:hypothetical protein
MMRQIVLMQKKTQQYIRQPQQQQLAAAARQPDVTNSSLNGTSGALLQQGFNPWWL